MNINFLIGVCGNARSGKDTFCRIAQIFLDKKKVGAARAAFADELKKDLDDLCRHKIGFSAFTDDPKNKEILRPLLVAYGTDIMRTLDENWWIDRLDKTLGVHQALELLPIITDVRYPNEMKWIKEKNGICIHITRHGIGPANKEEKKNDIYLKKHADFRLRWPTYGDEAVEKGDRHARRILNKIYKTKIKC